MNVANNSGARCMQHVKVDLSKTRINKQTKKKYSQKRRVANQFLKDESARHVMVPIPIILLHSLSARSQHDCVGYGKSVHKRHRAQAFL